MEGDWSCDAGINRRGYLSENWEEGFRFWKTRRAGKLKAAGAINGLKVYQKFLCLFEVKLVMGNKAATIRLSFVFGLEKRFF